MPGDREGTFLSSCQAVNNNFYNFDLTRPGIKLVSTVTEADALSSQTLIGQIAICQRWSRGHKARGQGQASSRTQKKSEAKDSLSEDRPSRGQGQGPRTQPQVFSKKRSSKSFLGDLQFISVPKSFDWERPKPRITCYGVIKSFQKRKFL